MSGYVKKEIGWKCYRKDIPGIRENNKELIYLTKTKEVAVFSLIEEKELRMKLPGRDQKVYGLWKMDKYIVVCKKSYLEVLEYETELTIKSKLETKGNVTAIEVTNKFIAYTSTNEPTISLLELPSLKSMIKINKDFEVYKIKIVDEHVIAMGIYVCAVYSIGDGEVKFTRSLLNAGMQRNVKSSMSGISFEKLVDNKGAQIIGK